MNSFDKNEMMERLKRVEGQIRGIQRMIDEGQYCVDVLVQIAAERAALNKVGMSLLERHTHGCVARAIREDRGDAAVDELMEVVDKFLK
ncbi:MAG: metal-sensitive transcriptional regulator [Syntrophothermus sp.]